MAKKKLNEAELDRKVNDTPAGESLHPESHPVDPVAKTAMLASAVAIMGGLDHGDLSKFLESLKLSQQGAAGIPDSAMAHNRSTIVPKGDAKTAMREDIVAAFKGLEDITEDTLDKVTTLFEAAVGLRLGIEVARLEEEYDTEYTTKLSEAVEQMNAEISTNLDDYLSYLAEEWLKENRIEVEDQVKTDIAMRVLAGIKTVFEENYIEVPQDKVDVVENMGAQLKDRDEQLNNAINENIALKKAVADAAKHSVVDRMAEGLSVNEVEKFKQLSESVEFEDAADLTKKLTIIKESYFTSKTTKKGVILTEEGIVIDVNKDKKEENDGENLSPEMKAYFDSIRSSVKN